MNFDYTLYLVTDRQLMSCDSLAVVSAIIAQSDIKAAAAELKDLFCGKEKKHGF